MNKLIKFFKIICLISGLILTVCRDIAVAQVSFTVDVDQGCAPLTVNFTNTSSIGDPYYWWCFGDGSPCNQKAVGDTSHTYLQPGQYWVWLYDSLFTSSAYHIIKVPGSSGDFIMSADSICPGDKVSMQSNDIASTYFWDFGDGYTSYQQYTNHTYSSPGNYDVRLILNSVCGIDTITKPIKVKNNLTISGFIDYSISPNPVCPGDKGTFNIWGDNVNTYAVHWDFGDGFSSEQQYTSHTYSSTGSYPITVTLTNGCGNDSIFYDTVDVQNNVPIGGNIYYSISPNPVCPGDEVRFQIWGTNVNNYAVNWDFGDGFSSTWSYNNHTYFSAGSYPVSVTLTNGCGRDTTFYDTVDVQNNVLIAGYINYSISPNLVCPGDGVNFFIWGDGVYGYAVHWDFGDGDSSSLQYNSHTYSSPGSYPITVTLTNGCGQDTTFYDTLDVQGNVPVSGWMDYNIYSNPACPGDEVNFNIWGENVYGYDTKWHFGDGDSSSLQYNSHIYSAAGLYPISVTLTNGCGRDTTFNETIDVHDSVPISGWIDYSISPNPACPGDEVRFNIWGENVYGYDVKWDFGDGDSSAQAYTYHTYDATGSYPISITLTNGCGEYIVLNTTVNVQNNVPVSGYMNFNTWPNPVCPGDEVQFNVWGDNVISYDVSWNFGDGASSSQQYATHVYDSAATFPVTVTLTSGCGGFVTLYGAANVQNNVPINTVSLYSPISSACPGDPLIFEVQGGPDSYSYIWDYGDSTIDSMGDFRGAHSYTDTGNYVVSVTVTNGCGNQTSAYTNININNNAFPVLNVFGVSGGGASCPGDSVEFFVWGDVPSVLWDFGDGDTSSATSISIMAGGPAAGTAGSFVVTSIKHVYASAGEYEATLTITNSCGNSVSDAVNVSIGTNVVPDAQFTTSFPFNGRYYFPGEQIDFSTFGGSSYVWDFGDGNIDTTTSSEISHQYAAVGTYTATLTLTNGCGNSDTWSNNIEVQDADYIIIAGTVLNDTITDTIRAGTVELYRKKSAANSYYLLRTTTISFTGYYQFDDAIVGTYYILAKPYGIFYPNSLPTYYVEAIQWDSAVTFVASGDTFKNNIIVQSFTVPDSGTGTIRGKTVHGNFGKVAGPGDPFDGIDITLIKKPANTIVGHDVSDAAGEFSHNNVALGTYNLYVDVAGIPVDVGFDIGITSTVTDVYVIIIIDSNLIKFTDSTNSAIEKLPATNSILTIYPNPTNGNFTITLNVQSVKDVEINLQNVLGQKIFAKKLNKFSGKYQKVIDLTSYPKGIYLLNATIGEHTVHEKVVHQ